MELSTYVHNIVTGITNGIQSARDALKDSNYTVDGEYNDHLITLRFCIDPGTFDVGGAASGNKIEFEVCVARKPEPRPKTKKKKYKRVLVDDEDEDLDELDGE